MSPDKTVIVDFPTTFINGTTAAEVKKKQVIQTYFLP